ncbi:MAG: hypothetical protein H6867_01500 [Rhodospirillales bacterium]|nr:hypothetical protein [Rhodospirillales bacterium]MCB9997192.1 hypothetical protein [Rhodospirillales bacterium]
MSDDPENNVIPLRRTFPQAEAPEPELTYKDVLAQADQVFAADYGDFKSYIARCYDLFQYNLASDLQHTPDQDKDSLKNPDGIFIPLSTSMNHGLWMLLVAEYGDDLRGQGREALSDIFDEAQHSAMEYVDSGVASSADDIEQADDILSAHLITQFDSYKLLKEAFSQAMPQLDVAPRLLHHHDGLISPALYISAHNHSVRDVIGRYLGKITSPGFKPEIVK